jgi:hypothetical protein
MQLLRAEQRVSLIKRWAGAQVYCGVGSKDCEKYCDHCLSTCKQSRLLNDKRMRVAHVYLCSWIVLMALFLCCNITNINSNLYFFWCIIPNSPCPCLSSLPSEHFGAGNDQFSLNFLYLFALANASFPSWFPLWLFTLLLAKPISLNAWLRLLFIETLCAWS